MSRLKCSFLALGLVSAFISFGVHAQETTVIEKKVIVSPTPKGVCTTVEGHWQGNIWIAAHDVCKYENRVEGTAWINDYWSCTAATADGTCTNWVFVPGHWVKTLQ